MTASLKAIELNSFLSIRSLEVILVKVLFSISILSKICLVALINEKIRTLHFELKLLDDFLRI